MKQIFLMNHNQQRAEGELTTDIPNIFSAKDFDEVMYRMLHEPLMYRNDELAALADTANARFQEWIKANGVRVYGVTSELFYLSKWQQSVDDHTGILILIGEIEK